MESRTRSASESHFEYYLGIESDCEAASRYVEFSSMHRDVHSHFFSQLLTTAAAEFESVSKAIALASSQNEPRNIHQIQEIYQSVVNCMHACTIRLRKGDLILKPFHDWKQGEHQLRWWKTYTNIKHSRHLNAADWSMVNALLTLGALYFANLVLIHTERRSVFAKFDCMPTKLFSLNQFPGEPRWAFGPDSERKLYFLNLNNGEGGVGVDEFSHIQILDDTF